MSKLSMKMALTLDWFEDAEEAIRSGDADRVRAIGVAPRKGQQFPSYLMAELLDADRADLLMIAQTKGVVIGDSLRLIFQVAIERPDWRPIIEADLLVKEPDVSKLLPVEAPVFAKAPEWLAHITKLLVKTWPDKCNDALAQACSSRDLPRMVLLLAAGLRPADHIVEYGSHNVRHILQYGMSAHGLLEITRKIGSLEVLLSAPIADQVRDIWPDFPIFDINADQ